jgi:hypothetical protein
MRGGRPGSSTAVCIILIIEFHPSIFRDRCQGSGRRRAIRILVAGLPPCRRDRPDVMIALITLITWRPPACIAVDVIDTML